MHNVSFSSQVFPGNECTGMDNQTYNNQEKIHKKPKSEPKTHDKHTPVKKNMQKHRQKT